MHLIECALTIEMKLIEMQLQLLETKSRLMFDYFFIDSVVFVIVSVKFKGSLFEVSIALGH